MKNKDLIEHLSALPQDLEVCIFDYRKNIHHAGDDFNGKGIEPKFEVHALTEKDDANKPFIAISFDNDDYKDDGTPDYGSSLAAALVK